MPASERELVVSRVVHAPAALAFNAWTEPAQLEQWWGPPDHDTRVLEMAVEPGGRARLVTRDRDGFESTTTLVYAGIIAAHTLSYMQSEDADPDHATEAFGVAARFGDEGEAQTRVTLSMVFKTAALRDQAARECEAGAGAHDTLRRLDRFLQAFLP